MMEDLLVKSKQLESEINQCEKEAQEHERQAREKRARRIECKNQLSELQLAINRAVSQQTARDAANSAEQAKQVAHDAASRILRKEKELEELIANLKAMVQPALPAPEQPKP